LFLSSWGNVGIHAAADLEYDDDIADRRNLALLTKDWVIS
jgi:hypothetical protein